MLCQSSIIRFILRVKKKKNQIETRQQGRCQFNILDDCLRFVPMRLNGIRCRQNRRASIQRTDNTGFGNGQCLLFLNKTQRWTKQWSKTATNHHFVKNRSGTFTHFIEFVNTTDTVISQHQCSTECSSMDQLISATLILTFAGPVDWSPDLWSHKLWDPLHSSLARWCTEHAAPSDKRTAAIEISLFPDLHTVEYLSAI